VSAAVPSRYIAIDGPIGVGKSSLARILAEEFGARLVLERPDENPFLKDFYRDMQRYALSTQLFFLMQRYQQQQEELSQEDLFARGGIISDYLFAKDRLFAALTLSPDELSLYDRLYQTLHPRTVTPDLVVYLQARTEVLWDRVAERGRPDEKSIRPEYLRDLASLYADFFFRYDASPLLIVSTSDMDFVKNAEDRAALVDVIRHTHAGVSHWSRR
jgi:deoxyadenosine/deoxycytidine kinase